MGNWSGDTSNAALEIWSCGATMERPCRPPGGSCSLAGGRWLAGADGAWRVGGLAASQVLNR